MSDELENINPYKILNVNKSTSTLNCKKVFWKLINSPELITKQKGAFWYMIFYAIKKIILTMITYINQKKRPFLLCDDWRFKIIGINL